MFLADGSCWGGAGLVRAGSDFSDRETDFLAAVAPAIADATRLAVRSEARQLDPGRPPSHRRHRSRRRTSGADRSRPGMARSA